MQQVVSVTGFKWNKSINILCSKSTQTRRSGAVVRLGQSSNLFPRMKKATVSKFNLSLCKKKEKKKREGMLGRECASNYLKCKTNKSQTCVTFSPIIINQGRIWRERLEAKHSPLLLAGQINLSLERLPVGPHAGHGKNKEHSQLRVPCSIQLGRTGGSLISRCPFQGWRPRGRDPPASSARPGQVLTWFSKSSTKHKD